MMKSVFIYSSIILFGAVLSAVAFFYSHNYFYLSEDERSALLFSENGFYYSFYNDIVSAKSLSEAYTRLVYDDRSEFGHTINAVQRFNIYQEIVLALVYRAVATVVVDLPSLIAPLTFYMCAVFVLFGCGLAAFVRLARKISVSDLPQARGATSSSSSSPSSSTAATNKSKSLSSAAASKWKSSVALFGWLNGLLALTLFLYNWRNVSRVQIHPPLRENFGMPLFFMQFGTLVDLISNHQRNTKTNFKTILNFVFFTTSFLLVWQFAHILLFIEVYSCFFYKKNNNTNNNNNNFIFYVIINIFFFFLVLCNCWFICVKYHFEKKNLYNSIKSIDFIGIVFDFNVWCNTYVFVCFFFLFLINFFFIKFQKKKKKNHF